MREIKSLLSSNSVLSLVRAMRLKRIVSRELLKPFFFSGGFFGRIIGNNIVLDDTSISVCVSVSLCEWVSMPKCVTKLIHAYLNQNVGCVAEWLVYLSEGARVRVHWRLFNFQFQMSCVTEQIHPLPLSDTPSLYQTTSLSQTHPPSLR